jgi:uncharacterized membrane protein YjgN (DUF898 family)
MHEIGDCQIPEDCPRRRSGECPGTGRNPFSFAFAAFIIVRSKMGSLEDGNRMMCGNCGAPVEYPDPGDLPVFCTRCGSRLWPEAENPAGPERYAFEFTASASEYFRIWIVNLFLTIITFGIYAAWAKVRTRRYIWANVSLAGHPFTFHGRPAAILKGNLIIAGIFILYAATKRFEPVVAGAIFIIFGFVFPFLVYKSLRFNAHNTSYRNIRFRFLGRVREAYETYLLFAGILPCTLFILFPAWQFYKKRFFFNNLAYGETKSSFSGRKGPFYKAYFLCAIMGITAFAFFSIIGSYWFNRLSASMGAPPGTFRVIFTFFFSSLLAAVILYTLQAAIYSMTMNHCWSQTRFGNLQFRSTLAARSLLFIRITNIAAIIFSLGLLVPWAKIRRLKYIFANLSIVSTGDLDTFRGVPASEMSALGDAATDFIGIEIGL